MKQILGIGLLVTFSIPYAFAAEGGSVSFGVIAGVPILSLFNNTSQTGPTGAGFLRYSELTNHYEIGPSLEFQFPYHFGLLFEGLYTHGSYNSTLTSVDTVASGRVTADFWQIPVMLRYRFASFGISPFIEGGASFRYISNTSASGSLFVAPMGSPHTFSIASPAELTNRFASGFVAGGGIDFHSRHVHFAPELRYTRWGWENFEQGLFHSNLNQVDVLLGIRF